MVAHGLFQAPQRDIAELAGGGHLGIQRGPGRGDPLPGQIPIPVGGRLGAEDASGVDDHAGLPKDKVRDRQGQAKGGQQHDHSGAEASTTHEYRTPVPEGIIRYAPTSSATSRWAGAQNWTKLFCPLGLYHRSYLGKLGKASSVSGAEQIIRKKGVSWQVVGWPSGPSTRPHYSADGYWAFRIPPIG